MAKNYKRILAAVFVVLLAASQIFLFPGIAHAGGETLTIRVQYAAEYGGREKAVFHKSEIEAASNDYYYSNITSFGTVMVMRARGVPIVDLIKAAGIDIASVKFVTFDTRDNYSPHSENFNRNVLTGKGYYYPSLNKRVVDPKTGEQLRTPHFKKEDNYIVPTEGFDIDAQTVPAIIAYEYEENKGPGKCPENFTDLSSENAYRFCFGQTKLELERRTTDSDVTSRDSVHSISGIDVTLEGHPVTGVHLDLDQKDLVVGSKAQISATLEGDELFSDYLNKGTLEWSSSDESIATVDHNGVVTMKKKGTVTITATAKDGTTGSVTITVGGKDETTEESISETNHTQASEQTVNQTTTQEKQTVPALVGGKDGNKNAEDQRDQQSAGQIKVKQIFLGAEVGPSEKSKTKVDKNVQVADRAEMADNATALDEAKLDTKGAAAGAGAGALAACGVGIGLRIRRFRKEL